MNTGRIFDIRRFSTHDGAGLRTNIFFKGCPLRCVWCQNPEGLECRAQPVWFANQCIGCGTCLRLTKCGGIRKAPDGLILDGNRPEPWETILDECPTGALMMDSREYTVEELVHEAEKDRIFYRYGGGVTVSGGEPLMQGGFVAELMEALRDKGFHTAIETSLFAPLKTVQRIMPFVDQIYADMKLADRGEHIRYTGVPNERIRENLAWLLTSPLRERVTIRTPLIPGMTATEDNLTAIAKFLSGLYPEVKYELLNYNPLAEAKYRNIQRDYCFTEEENPKLYTKDQMLRFGEIVRAGGIRNQIIEI